MLPTTPITFNTFSIVACDPVSGMYGVAASTKLPAVGRAWSPTPAPVSEH
jgi:uncharacterized Ntn-hydrolase superfamily protein